MSTNLVPKSSNIYTCKLCHYTTSRKSQFDRHNSTAKHKNQQISTIWNLKVPDKSNLFICNCGKNYKERTGLWKHKKVCNYEIINTNISDTNISETNISDKNIQNTNLPDTNLIMMLVKQNSELLEVIKNGTHNNYSNNTNSNNKTFNLNLFLNETCKDAMNIMDFVDSIKLQLSDLEKVGEIGYVDGISNIIVKQLNALEVEKRPVHCTDKKREILYVKDENKWEKENEEKNKLRKVIKKIANKNSRLLPQFKEKYPDCVKSSSPYSDQYNKLIVEAMGGSGDNDLEKEDKIIRKIAKEVIINKNLEIE